MAVFPFPAAATALGDPMTLSRLVAQAAPSQLAQSAPTGAPPPGHVVSPADAVEEVAIERNPLPQSKYKTGIIQGFLRPGSTGGNILGALGDAFLIQAGRDPMYAPRLQGLREQEALENFRTNPEEAIDLMTQVNPQAAMKLAQQVSEDERLDARSEREATESAIMNQVRQAQLRQSEQEYGNTIDSRAISMLGNANAKTYPALRARVLAYYKSQGREPPFELPETWDEAAVQAVRMSQVPVGKQLELDDRRAYQQGQLAAARSRAASQAESARASTIRATRPPTPRNDTTGNVLAAIMRKDPSKRTAEERRLLEVWESRGRAKPSAGASGGGGRWVKNPETGKYERRN